MVTVEANLEDVNIINDGKWRVEADEFFNAEVDEYFNDEFLRSSDENMSNKVARSIRIKNTELKNEEKEEVKDLCEYKKNMEEWKKIKVADRNFKNRYGYNYNHVRPNMEDDMEVGM